MKTALFFGSFNPIHIGHLSIAQFVLNNTEVEHIEFVLSPHNPHKNTPDLLPEQLRKELLLSAIKDNSKFSLNAIEFQLPRPSYTSNTLQVLESTNQTKDYHILMGSDTLENLHKWHHPEHILTYPILVYPRAKTFANPHIDSMNIHVMETPILEISATYLRNLILENKSTRYLMHESSLNFVNQMREYLLQLNH
jgi:nicotinate-nucleotide adenylyltransferase